MYSVIVGLSPQTGHSGLRRIDLVDGRVERVEEEQPPGERLAGAEHDLQRLARLERADDARQDAEDAALRAARRELGRRGRGYRQR